MYILLLDWVTIFIMFKFDSQIILYTRDCQAMAHRANPAVPICLCIVCGCSSTTAVQLRCLSDQLYSLLTECPEVHLFLPGQLQLSLPIRISHYIIVLAMRHF
jgi:hypothetical protein